MIRFLCVSAAMVLLPAAGFSASLTLAEAAMREDKAAVRALIAAKGGRERGARRWHHGAALGRGNEMIWTPLALLIQAGANVKAQGPLRLHTALFRVHQRQRRHHPETARRPARTPTLRQAAARPC